MKRIAISFFKSENAVTAMEYGLIAALVAVGLIAVLGELGGRLDETFSNIRDELGTANSEVTP